MRPTQGKWSDLQVGSYMKDATGKTWRVIAEREFHLQIQDRDGKKATLRPRDPRTPVTIMGATEEEAMTALRTTLGARVVARREAGETGWLVPPFPTTGGPGALEMGHSHLMMMHGIWTRDVKRLAGLIECHEDSHRDPDPHGYQEHTHPGGNA